MHRSSPSKWRHRTVRSVDQPGGAGFSLRRASVHLSALAISASETLLQTWRGHSCRGRCVGYASACPVERSSTCMRVFLQLRSSGMETATQYPDGLEGGLQVRLPAIRKVNAKLPTLAGLDTGPISRKPTQAACRPNTCPTKEPESISLGQAQACPTKQRRQECPRHVGVTGQLRYYGAATVRKRVRPSHAVGVVRGEIL